MTEDKAASIPEAKNVDTFGELTAEQLDCVVGGKVQYQDFHFVKLVDRASP